MYNGPNCKTTTSIQQKRQLPLLKEHVIDDLFTFTKLEFVIDAQKHNKTPGPDGCRAQLLNWLSATNRNFLLSLYNDMIRTHQFPDTLKKTNLVAIYKKGDASQMQNYRLIAQLQGFYRLAGMIRTLLTSTCIRLMDPKGTVCFSSQEINNASYLHRKKITGPSRTTTFKPVDCFTRLGESF